LPWDCLLLPVPCFRLRQAADPMAPQPLPVIVSCSARPAARPNLAIEIARRPRTWLFCRWISRQLYAGHGHRHRQAHSACSGARRTPLSCSKLRSTGSADQNLHRLPPGRKTPASAAEGERRGMPFLGAERPSTPGPLIQDSSPRPCHPKPALLTSWGAWVMGQLPPTACPGRPDRRRPDCRWPIRCAPVPRPWRLLYCHGRHPHGPGANAIRLPGACSTRLDPTWTCQAASPRAAAVVVSGGLLEETGRTDGSLTARLCRCSTTIGIGEARQTLAGELSESRGHRSYRSGAPASTPKRQRTWVSAASHQPLWLEGQDLLEQGLKGGSRGGLE